MTKFDFQFQNKVLALLLQDSEFLSRFGDIVRPENFADPSHQKICEMLCNYWKAFGSRPTFEALIEEVGRSEHSYGQDFDTLIDQIEVILDTDISEDREYYARQTVKFCREKSVVQALVNSAEFLKAGKVEEIIPLLEKSLSVGEDLQSFGLEYWQGFRKRYQEAPMARVPTMVGGSGRGSLDEAMRGGLAQARVGIVMMPTGRGKSTFLVNIAGNASALGHNVVFISVELEEYEVSERFDVFFSGVPSADLDGLSPDQREEMVLSAYPKRGGNLVIKSFPMKSLTVRQLEAFVKHHTQAAGWSPDLLVLDYLDEMRPYSQNRQTHEQLAEISSGLKAMAQRFKIPIWTATQSNRGAAQRNFIENEDSSGSYAKLFPLDVVLTMNPRTDRDGNWSGDLYVAKNRGGQSGRTFHFDLDFPRMRFIYNPMGRRDETVEAAVHRVVGHRRPA